MSKSLSPSKLLRQRVDFRTGMQLPKLHPLRHKWLSGAYIYQMRRSHIENCIAVLERGIKRSESDIIRYTHGQQWAEYFATTVHLSLRYAYVWIARFKRELVIRKKHEQYRKLIGLILTNPAEKNSYAVCADWLEEHGYMVLSRRMRLQNT